MSNDKKWTTQEIELSLRNNVVEYGSAIAVAALYKKLYGVFPNIGLSGAQAGMADQVCSHLPDKLEQCEDLDADAGICCIDKKKCDKNCGVHR